MAGSGSAIDWLLDSDPSIRWQVMRDLLDAPEPQWTAERAKVETEGWGARLLSYEAADGQWAGGACAPGAVHAREWRAPASGSGWGSHGRPPRSRCRSSASSVSIRSRTGPGGPSS